MKPPGHWDRLGRDWPNREASTFVQADGRRWHVQRLGAGPCLLLLHGAGAASHSWAGLAPILAERFQVLAPDLPGHGFTGAGDRNDYTLPGMARAVASLLQSLQQTPALALGHSAGAAVLARMCLDGLIDPAGLVSLNGALMPFGAALRPVYSAAARVLARVPLLPDVVSRQALRPGAVERMIHSTGSCPTRSETRHYRSLVQHPDHVAATLRMMANWDLTGLARELPGLRPRLLLLACSGDQAVPPDQARQIAARVPGSRFRRLPGLGHLGHEEDPATVAAEVAAFAADLGICNRGS